MSKAELRITPHDWGDWQVPDVKKPKWIKAWTSLLENPKWLALSDAERGLLLLVWLEYARAGTAIFVQNLCRNCDVRTQKLRLEALRNAGFLEFSTAKMEPSRARRSENKPKPGLAVMPSSNSARELEPEQQIPDFNIQDLLRSVPSGQYQH
jgi:hypothetical protein